MPHQTGKRLQLLASTSVALLICTLFVFSVEKLRGVAWGRLRATITTTETVAVTLQDLLGQQRLAGPRDPAEVLLVGRAKTQRADPVQQPPLSPPRVAGGSDFQAAPAGEPLTSSLQAHASYAGPNKTLYHFSFYNVRLTRKQLEYFSPQGSSPPNPHWMLVGGGNATLADPPTVLLFKGDAGVETDKPLPIQYATAPASPASCKGWIERPAYLLQVRNSHNIWHAWDEGLMATFQTLREAGALPLVQIIEDGSMREVTEGVGGACTLGDGRLVGKFILNATGGCNLQSGAEALTRCDPKSQIWCRQGVWRQEPRDGPLIIPYTPSSVDNPWGYLYGAISDDIRGLSEVEGWCFRRLIVGKSATLNFYQKHLLLKDSEAEIAARAARIEAIGVFKAFMTTAQQEWAKQQAAKQPQAAQFKGYDKRWLERLRRGIGPEEIALADTIIPPHALGTPPPTDPEELYRMWHREEKYPGEGGSDVQQADAAAEEHTWEREERQQDRELPTTLPLAGTAGGSAQHESPRPVVTYMARHSFRRAVLNEHQVLRYILARYNVTLRVTTLQEPLLDVMQLLQHTDVLVGMHGAGWTNGVFIKSGATAVQLHPYGWLLPSGRSIRGTYYREVLLANSCKYMQWFNPNPHHAFFRSHDFTKKFRVEHGMDYQLHPQPSWELPTGAEPGEPWVDQNTFVDMASFGPVLDEAMRRSKIRPMQGAGVPT